jgi:hypothetical protein
MLVVRRLRLQSRRRTRCVVEECLDDVCKRAKRAGWAPLALQMEFLPNVIESAAMEPYLKRWTLLDA